ncbi:MAG: peptidylprolyl isomerase [Chloroflexi bacterium]|nr:peptidylprolyl isomerase [Chloroflexota bacterium]
MRPSHLDPVTARTPGGDARGAHARGVQYPVAAKRYSLPHGIALFLGVAAILLLAACSSAATPAATSGNAAKLPPQERSNMYQAPPPMTIDVKKTYVATIKTAKGDIVVELYPKDAPQTVNNFVFLARDGFYNNLTFHRVEPGFVIQGGDPLGTGTGGPGYTIPAEIKEKHSKGAIAMARLPDQVNPKRDSSGSQFYITLEATPFLDGAYTAFGQVTQGMDVVQKIARGDVIQSISISEK